MKISIQINNVSLEIEDSRDADYNYGILSSEYITKRAIDLVNALTEKAIDMNNMTLG